MGKTPLDGELMRARWALAAEFADRVQTPVDP
jgi:hypothetical protein